MQVGATDGVVQIEEPAAWQWLAPEQLVVLPKTRTVHVGVPSARVSPEVKRRIDHHRAASVPLLDGRDLVESGGSESACVGGRGIARYLSCSTFVEMEIVQDYRHDATSFERPSGLPASSFGA